MMTIAENCANSLMRHVATTSEAWLADRTSGPMPAGSVLVHAPSAAFQAPGGGEVQLVSTARHLEAIGVAVRPFVPWVDRIEDARVLHLFGIAPEGYALAKLAKARGIPVCLSTICWYEPRAIWALGDGIVRKSLDISKWCVRRLAPRLPSWKGSFLRSVDRLLPNSNAEAEQLRRLFDVDPSKVRVVPNGVEPRKWAVGPELFRERFGAGEFALFVGRVEPRKNLLNCIRGAIRAGVRLVVVGAAPPGHEDYERTCRRIGGGQVTWVGHLAHDDPLLESAYESAGVLALPSWFETPGLVALEAGRSGCPLLLTPHGCTREYFGELARYADPGSPRSIGEGLRAAIRGGREPSLSEFVKSRYLWPATALATAEVYHELDR